jgi:hypothetical protein
VSKYSTARSGLLNAALIALPISAFSNPILSIFAMAASCSEPVAKTLGSSKALDGVATAACDDGAGVGVAGTSASAAGADEPPTGAGGGAGVSAALGAGVAGSAADDDAATGLGYSQNSALNIFPAESIPFESYTL